MSGKIIKAGEGVILKSTDSNISLTYTSTAATDADYESNLLEGVDNLTTISTSAYASKVIYTLANEGGLGLYKYYDNVSSEKYTTNETLAANKAFLALDAAPSAARGFVLSFGEDVSGIKSLTPDPSPKGEGSSYYTLEGRKLNGKPTRKGVYIVNGYKVAIK